jgi:hypothetical protein
MKELGHMLLPPLMVVKIPQKKQARSHVFTAINGSENIESYDHKMK